MKRLLSIGLKLVTTGTVTLFLAACYGVMTVVDFPRQGAEKTITIEDVDDPANRGDVPQAQVVRDERPGRTIELQRK